MAMLEGSKLGFFKFDGIDKAIFRHQEIAARKDVDLIASMGHDFAIDRPEDSGAPIRSIGIGEADMSEDLEIFLDREVPAAVFPFDFFGFHFNFSFLEIDDLAALDPDIFGRVKIDSFMVAIGIAIHNSSANLDIFPANFQDGPGVFDVDLETDSLAYRDFVVFFIHCNNILAFQYGLVKSFGHLFSTI